MEKIVEQRSLALGRLAQNGQSKSFDEVVGHFDNMVETGFGQTIGEPLNSRREVSLATQKWGSTKSRISCDNRSCLSIRFLLGGYGAQGRMFGQDIGHFDQFHEPLPFRAAVLPVHFL